MTKFEINSDLCVGHGQCYVVVPDPIEDDERGLAHVRGDGQVPVDRREALRRAQKSCPEGALLLTDDAED